MLEFSPLCIGRLKLQENFENIYNLSDSIHLDIMDNSFVDNSAFDVKDINSFDYKRNKHIHIMSKNVEYIIDSINVKVESISFHYEATVNYEKISNIIKKKNIIPGIVVNPETQYANFNHILHLFGRVIVMAVKPGFSGQKYIEGTTEKIIQIRNDFRNIELVVDGGMNEQTIFEVTRNGADSVVVCSVIAKSNNCEKKIYDLKNIIREGKKKYQLK
jgi:ribulose-phosphate 3-epimerase